MKKRYKDVIDKNRKSGEGNEIDHEISVKDFPWFDAIHNVMKDREVTNPPHVIDSSNTQQVDVSRRDSEEDELLTSIPHENPSTKESIGEDGSKEELIQTSSVERRQIPSSIQPNSRVQTPTTQPNSGRQTPSSLEPSSHAQTLTTQPNSSSTRQTPSSKDSTESGMVITTFAGEKRTTSQSASKKKKRKASKMERAEKASADMLEEVMKKVSEQKERFELLERESSKKRKRLDVSH